MSKQSGTRRSSVSEPAKRHVAFMINLVKAW
jgi:hypothetical protein